MTINGREIRYEELFYDALQGLELYWGQSNPRRGREWSSDLVDFTMNVIAPNPLAFPRLEKLGSPSRELRKAVFRKNYLIIYQVTPDRVDFLAIVHTSRNLDFIQLDGNV
jgi:plasmid stabilization system protein ParE